MYYSVMKKPLTYSHCFILWILQVSYSFRRDCEDCSSFLLDSSSGLITANEDSFDSSRKNQYTLYIVAQDGAPSSLPNTNAHNQGMNNVV